MKIELSNGQLKFWQWDAGQKVQVPENVPTVHLKFGKSAVELPVLDRWVDVPDELLQTGKDILLWTYDEDHTLDAVRIPVEKRLKPADYVYTPTEIKTWESLDSRIKALEDGGGIAGVSSVNGQTGAVTITAEGLGALTEDNLQIATNAALAQAKASGEFDGAPGAPGTPGNDGLSINWRGEYVESTAYAKNDAVSYGGSAYIMVSNSVIGAVPGIDDDWQLMVQKGAAGPQGPAGAGLDVTGATVGQTVKISAVDDNGVPTAWVPVDMASGGEEKPLTLIADVVISDGEAVSFEYTDLGGLTELYLAGNLINGAIDTVLSGIVNGTKVGASLLPVKKTITNETWNYWCTMRFNGAFWVVKKSPEHGGADPVGVAYPMAASYSVLLGIGAAESLYLYVPNPAYKPTSGWVKIWGR